MLTAADYAAVPAEMKELPNWICWRFDWNGTKWNKTPCNPATGHPANSATMCTTFEDAIAACNRHKLTGIGFMFTKEAGIVGIDLDHVLDKNTGQIIRDNQRLDELADMLPAYCKDTYLEISPSGDGLHMYVFGKKPGFAKGEKNKEVINGREYAYEMYDHARYFTVTGRQYPGSQNTVCRSQGLIDEVYKRFIEKPDKQKAEKKNADSAQSRPRTDEEVLELFKTGQKAEIYYRLYEKGDTSKNGNDDSRADYQLAAALAFFTEDKGQIERLMRGSALARSKYDTKRGSKTYLSYTIDNAFKDPRVDVGGYEKWLNDMFDDLSIKHPAEYNDTETGIVFAKTHSKICRFCPTAKKWFFWDGKRWNTENSYMVYAAFHEFISRNAADLEQGKQRTVEDINAILIAAGSKIRDIQKVATAAQKKTLAAIIEKQDKKIQARFYNLMDKLQNFEQLTKDIHKYKTSNNIRGALEQAKGHSEIVLAKMDADGYILNTPGGMLDLRTGEIMDHDPDRLCSKITAEVTGDNAQMWYDFLSYVTEGDKQEQTYLQYICGMAALGRVENDITLFIAHGRGGNGKSTLFNTIARVFGDYAGRIDSEMLIITRQNKERDAVNLRGKRFVLCSELGSGTTLDVGAVKRFCSKDTIDARYLYGEKFEIEPSHTTILPCNHAPGIPGKSRNDESLFPDRMRVLAFTAESKRGAEDQIQNYATKLFDECGAVILEWITDGAYRFIADGYNLPEMSERMIDYQAEILKQGDTMSKFFNNCTVKDPRGFVAKKDFDKALEAFYSQEGATTPTDTEIRTEIKLRNYKLAKTKSGRGYRGFMLFDAEFEEIMS